MTLTYEGLRTRLDSLPKPVSDEAREVLWVLDRDLGVALTGLGAFEIFISGARLHAMSSTVRRHLQHDRWQAAGAAPFEANRIVLPAEDHFKAVAALIVIEMLRLGLGADKRSVQQVFSEVEPIVELALRRGALAEEVQIGLIGELLCLEQVLVAVGERPELRSAALDMWRGHQHASRDFELGATAVEVKTTTQASSIHVAHSLAQIEAQATDNVSEDRVLLLSIGLVHTGHDGYSLPGTTERLLRLLREPGVPAGALSPLQDRFLDDLKRYGGSPDEGYDHLRMRTLRVYQTNFTPTFVPRLYDLSDEDVLLLRRDDLKGKFVLPERVEYGFALPDRVNERNPVPTWQNEVRGLARASLGL